MQAHFIQPPLRIRRFAAGEEIVIFQPVVFVVFQHPKHIQYREESAQLLEIQLVAALLLQLAEYIIQILLQLAH